MASPALCKHGHAAVDADGDHIDGHRLQHRHNDAAENLPGIGAVNIRDSYSSLGMFCSPARKYRMLTPVQRHVASSSSVTMDISGTRSHLIRLDADNGNDAVHQRAGQFAKKDQAEDGAATDRYYGNKQRGAVKISQPHVLAVEEDGQHHREWDQDDQRPQSVADVEPRALKNTGSLSRL